MTLDQAAVLPWKSSSCTKYMKRFPEPVGYGNFSLINCSTPPMFSRSQAFRCSTAHPTGWLHLFQPPLGGRMWVQLLVVSLTARCANTAVMSWGERRLITDCSVFLPVPLGEPCTVNWTTTPKGAEL